MNMAYSVLGIDERQVQRRSSLTLSPTLEAQSRTQQTYIDCQFALHINGMIPVPRISTILPMSLSFGGSDVWLFSRPCRHL